MLFQISCQKQVNANPNQVTQQNKLAYIKNPSGSTYEVWTCNLDGTNQTKVPITFPSGLSLENGEVTITPDGSKIVLGLRGFSPNVKYIYTCNLDGSSMTKIVGDGTANVGYYSITAY
ncbi:MAG: hypothetical protein U0T31_03130 [Chitinophagales bacterium]